VIWADWHILHPSIVDDTGVRRAVEFANWSRVRPASDPGTRFAIDSVARIVRPIGGPPGIATWAIIGALAGGIVVGFVRDIHQGRGGDLGTWFGPVISVAIIAGVFWYLPRWNLWRYGSAIVPVIAARGLCPCCAYSLREVSRADGRVRCPECGGEWNASRLSPTDAAESIRGGLERIATTTGARRPLLDDAGKHAYAMIRTPKRAAADEPDAGLRARQLDAHRAIRGAGMSVRFAIVFGAVLVTLMGLMDSVPSFRWALTWDGIADFFRGFGVVIVLTVLVARSSIGVSGDAARKRLLARGLCPTCVSDLSGIAPNTEGLCQCAVCGGAWRANVPITPST